MLILLLLLLCAVFLLIDTTHERLGSGVLQKQQHPQILTIDPRPSRKISRVDYGFFTNFIVYARDFEVREEKKCHATCKHVKNDSFHFHFVFFRSRDVNLELTWKDHFPVMRICPNIIQSPNATDPQTIKMKTTAHCTNSALLHHHGFPYKKQYQ
jgi:hypothetical protein